jgi:hypothetical protein
MRICALEVPAGFGDPHGRLADIRSALMQGEPADLIVVPECALTGYVSRDLRFDLRPFAEPLEGPTLSAYRALAREHKAHFVGPLVEQCRGAFFNSFVVVDLRTGIFRTLVRRFGLTVVNANWGEGEPRVRGQGRSRIVGPGGAVEAPRLAGQVSRVSAEVLPKPTDRCR